LFDRFVKLFATQPAMFYIERCGHKQIIQLAQVNYSWRILVRIQ